MSTMPVLRVSCRPQDRELHLLVNYVQRTSSCCVSVDLVPGNSPQLEVDSSVAAEGTSAVGRSLVGHSQPNSRQSVCLLGQGASENAAIWQWCDAAHQLKTASSRHSMLQHINDWLASRSFLATHCLSLADLWLYAVCHPILSSNFSFGGFQHLARWFEQVHNTEGVRGLYPDVALYRV
ncbi:uncharacterized protein LOC135815386 [Sycon ciliatum]|uniref:uncharacterized protein LOC135815386 n=1 Tax=Sycon ciliatum TaxID=27933 RepID=UPI0020AE0B4E|eukprot:scpid89115/ scgid7562/ 